MASRAHRVVRVEYSLHWAIVLIYLGLSDGGHNAVARAVREFVIEQLAGVSAALARQAGIQPLFCDALQLAKQVELRLFAGIAEALVDEVLCQYPCSLRAGTPTL